MIFSLIPAKVNSSRLPGKNTFKFLLDGKPLIAYTIEAVKAAVIQPNVFTNEEDIKDNFGSIIVSRSSETCTPQSTMKSVVAAFVEKLGIKQDDIILLTYLTCPFRTSENLKKALELFQKSGASSLQSVNAVDYRPFGLMQQDGNCDYKFTCLRDQQDFYQQQNTPTLYKANGAIYIFKVSELKNLNNQMFNAWTVGCKLNPIESLDIDTELDFMFAEKILERKQNERLVNQLSSEGISEAESCTSWSRLHSEHFETSRT